MSGKEINEQSSFSTKDWQAQNYKYLLTIVDKAGNTFEKEGSFRVDELESSPPINDAECVLFHKCGDIDP